MKEYMRAYRKEMAKIEKKLKKDFG